MSFDTQDIRRNHLRYTNENWGGDYCRSDGQVWPCAMTLALDEIDALSYDVVRLTAERDAEAKCRAAITFLPPSATGDIENTAERYAEAARLRGEATVTINPYVGPETALPFLKRGIGVRVPRTLAWGAGLDAAITAWAEQLGQEYPGLVTVLEPPEARAAAGGEQGEE